MNVLGSGLTVVAIAVILGCGAPAAAPATGGGEPRGERPSKRMTAAIIGNPHTLSQKLNATGAGSVPGVDHLEDLVSAGLSNVGDDGKLFPVLGTAVPSVADGSWRLLPDGRMETSWTIQDNARWHDGTPVSGADLAFTLRLGQDRQLAVFRDVAYDSIDGFGAGDARTFTVTWSQPYIRADQLFSRLLAIPLPAHLLESTYLNDRESLVSLPHWTQAFVGTGPFRVREWVEGTQVVLEANNDFVLGRPLVDEITVKFILDPNTVVANALAGSVDLTLGRGLAIETAREAGEKWRSGRADPGNVQSWIAMFPQFLDASPPTVGDVRLRRALLHAMDRDGMAQVLQYGVVPAAHSYLNPRTPEYPSLASSEVRYPFDPTAAARLIEDVGYQRGPDGLFRDSAGEPLLLEVRTIDDHGIQERTVFTIADYWQKVGITTSAVLIPRQRQPDRPYRAGFPAFEMLKQASDFDAPVRAHSAQTPLPENNYSGTNRSRYRSPAFDALLNRYLVTVPFDVRLEVTRQIVHHMTDQVVWMGIFYDTEPLLISGRLRNVAAAKAPPGYVTWNAYRWDVA